MKVVILAGGFGTRITEESATKPKPMVEIGGRPMLWHIMKIYSHFGLNDFVICLGYKGYVIKEFFANYALGMSDVRFNLTTNKVEFLSTATEPWTVTLVDTGDKTLTGGRLLRVRQHVGNETFCMTYGDGVSNLDLHELIQFHRAQKTLSTVTAVQPPGRFGAFALHDGQSHVPQFKEKPKGDGTWINGGFFVLEPGIFDYIEGDSTSWEEAPMERLAAERQMSAFRHADFWQNMDTLRDKMFLDSLWNQGNAPWKHWSR